MGANESRITLKDVLMRTLCSPPPPPGTTPAPEREREPAGGAGPAASSRSRRQQQTELNSPRTAATTGIACSGPIPFPPIIDIINSYATGPPLTSRVIAGSIDSEPGMVNGMGLESRFNEPRGVVLWKAPSYYGAASVSGLGMGSAGSVGSAGSASGSARSLQNFDSVSSSDSLEHSRSGGGGAKIRGEVMLLADMQNQLIRVIELDTFTVSTLDRGSYPITKSDELRFPIALAVDPSDNSLLISESVERDRIRRMQADGSIALVAGGTKRGYANGVGAAAEFNSVVSMLVTHDGRYCYAADRNNFRVRRIDLTTQEVTTVAGTGTAAVTSGAPMSAAGVGLPRFMCWALAPPAPPRTSAASPAPSPRSAALAARAAPPQQISQVAYVSGGSGIIRLDFKADTGKRVLTLPSSMASTPLLEFCFLTPTRILGHTSSALYLFDLDPAASPVPINITKDLLAALPSRSSEERRHAPAYEYAEAAAMVVQMNPVNGDDRVFMIDRKAHAIKLLSGAIFANY